ncbi:MAG: hypothetical protein QXO71_11930 [Candidatus Jordarchaeaceae archaeon]
MASKYIFDAGFLTLAITKQVTRKMDSTVEGSKKTSKIRLHN